MRISDWSSDVCSSDLRDVVGEGEDVLIIAVVPFERDLDADIVALAGDRARIGEQRRLGAIEPFDERRDAAYVMQHDYIALLAAFVGVREAHARIWASQPEERRVGQRGVRTCKSRWAPYH